MDITAENQNQPGMLLKVQQEARLKEPGDHSGHLFGADDMRVEFDAQLVHSGQRQDVQQLVFGAFDIVLIGIAKIF